MFLFEALPRILRLPSVLTPRKPDTQQLVRKDGRYTSCWTNGIAFFRSENVDYNELGLARKVLLLCEMVEDWQEQVGPPEDFVRLANERPQAPEYGHKRSIARRSIGDVVVENGKQLLIDLVGDRILKSVLMLANVTFDDIDEAVRKRKGASRDESLDSLGEVFELPGIRVSQPPGINSSGVLVILFYSRRGRHFVQRVTMIDGTEETSELQEWCRRGTTLLNGRLVVHLSLMSTSKSLSVRVVDCALRPWRKRQYTRAELGSGA